jgi:hypothetical protein
MKECNHTLGYWYGIESEVEFLYQDNIIDRIQETIEENIRFNEYCDKLSNIEDWMKRKILNPLDYLDNRKNIIHKFEYCPYCGEKINWKEIKSKLK